MSDDLTPEQREGQNRLHDLFAELTELIGPSFGGKAQEELDPDEMPEGAVFLSEWVCVLYWLDETAAGFTTRIASSNLPLHHRIGLLHEALYGFDD